ncbi:MAG: pyridoxamine 5'-phosphate oxidase family protein [Deltaproteobacteria bacterium]|jgi:nitroimidazol reductase NimA-like FMN-containing flavoprotein (pyridoxamine 5'-phosphate oxidase superfamily)|nr:pyridoxamine 5'-phosphate oxidase family protein [Deltaproteobacteria bacterium]
MSTTMTREEREAFLSGVHVGVLSIHEEGRGPLTAPVWYAYEPGGEVQIVTERDSRKGKLLKEGMRVSLCAQDEAAPYKYASVEGPVVRIEPSDVERNERVLAHRYLGPEAGDRYIASASEGRDDDLMILVRIRPERWLTADYSKEDVGL